MGKKVTSSKISDLRTWPPFCILEDSLGRSASPCKITAFYIFYPLAPAQAELTLHPYFMYPTDYLPRSTGLNSSLILPLGLPITGCTRFHIYHYMIMLITSEADRVLQYLCAGLSQQTWHLNIWPTCPACCHCIFISFGVKNNFYETERRDSLRAIFL